MFCTSDSQYVSGFDELVISQTSGDKLGLLDEQNLKFATSQVLREGPRAGADAVRTQFASDGRSRGAPAAGESIKIYCSVALSRSNR